MEIIPVIDILAGTAVHAVGGRRDEYRPLRSILCDTSNPLDVALALKRAFEFTKLYLADLDAILGRVPNLELYRQIRSKVGFEVIVDAGISNLKAARRVIESGVSRVVIGTETLIDLDFVKEAVSSFGKDRIIASLDLMEGKVLSKIEEIRTLSPLSIARKLRDLGIDQLIVIDLTRVGTGRGVDFELIKKILDSVKIDLLAGGGIRNLEDLKTLREIGVKGALLATALHTGSITPEDLESEGFYI